MPYFLHASRLHPLLVTGAGLLACAAASTVHAQTTPLIVRKAGLGADVFFFAHNYSAVYGVIAVILAVAAGVLAAFVFRKG